MVVLMMLSNQLKQLAKDYNIFIASSTQVNATAMQDDDFKNENCIRGSRAVADKVDCGCIVTRVSDKLFNSLLPKIKIAIRDGKIAQKCALIQPTHVIDIYKMRRGEYKNVRIWCVINLGTGRREDLFMTRDTNEIIGNDEIVDLFSSATEELYDWRSEYVMPDLGKDFKYEF